MTKARMDGIYLLSLGCIVFALLGSALESASTVSMTDFRAYYYSARCLLQNHDPYNEREVARVYRAQETERPQDSARNQLVITRYIYLPPAFLFSAPIAMLPFGIAHVVWMMANIGWLILAAVLAWDLGAQYAPIISGGLVGFLLANSELVVVTGNAVGISIGLCVTAVWCLMKERFAAIGVVCMAVSLALKPHDAGLVWLYFLLAGGIHRKRALQMLGATIALSLPGTLWVTCIAPHWIQELQSNIRMFSVHGGLTDPGPSSSGAHAMAMQ